MIATSRLTTFFHGSDTQFGIFYPKHVLLAVFPNLPDACQARKTLLECGDGEDSIAVVGEEVVDFAEEYLWKEGLWGMLMTQLSRALDAEAVYSDKDLEMARNGAAFLAVHCPTEDAKTAAWKCLEPAHPVAARYYTGRYRTPGGGTANKALTELWLANCSRKK
jgi:hypothetical protein